MQYRNKPALQDRLAAEYALGTLRGPARLRFEAWMREDAALRRTVEAWQGRLAPLAQAVPERAPPRRLWQAIERRLGAAAPEEPRAGWWDSLAFWRNWGLVATGCTAALVGALALRAPQVVEVPVIKQVEVESRRMQPSYIAVLHAAGEKGDRMMFVAYAARNSDELWVKRMELPQEPHNHSYELWGLPGSACCRQARSPPSSWRRPPTSRCATSPRSPSPSNRWAARRAASRPASWSPRACA